MKYALIVANTEYSDPLLAKLSAPGKDAEDFARVLQDKEIGEFDDVKVLLNQPEPIAREAIDEFFDQKKPDDLLILYFSGHGIRDEVGSLYLALKNTTRARLRATAIKSDFIRDVMNQSRSKRQIVILDCCNSGAFAQGSKAIVGASMGTASAFQGAGYGHIVLTASDSTQFAWEGDQIIGDETDNSLFTHFLIEGLKGEADQNNDGIITVDDLFDYAYEQIVMKTPKQTPGKWSYKQQGDIVLRKITQIEKIKPVSLSDELLEAIEDSRTFVREGAVGQLAKIIKGKNLGLVRSAREALEKIEAEDDSRKVSQLASQALENIRKEERLSAQKTKEEHSALKKAEAEWKNEEDVQRFAAQKAEEEYLTRQKDRLDKKSKENALASEVVVDNHSNTFFPRWHIAGWMALGWAIVGVIQNSVLFDGFVTSLYNFFNNEDVTRTVYFAVVFALIGLSNILVLRSEKIFSAWKNIFWIPIGWAVGGVIGSLIIKTIYELSGWDYDPMSVVGAIAGIFGGFCELIIIRSNFQFSFAWKNVIWIPLGYLLGIEISRMSLETIARGTFTVLWDSVYEKVTSSTLAIISNVYYVSVGAIAFAIGGGIAGTILVLILRKQNLKINKSFVNSEL